MKSLHSFVLKCLLPILVVVLILFASKETPLQKVSEYQIVHSQQQNNPTLDDARNDRSHQVEYVEEQNEDEREESEDHIEIFSFFNYQILNSYSSLISIRNEFVITSDQLKSPIPLFILYSSLRVYCL